MVVGTLRVFFVYLSFSSFCLSVLVNLFCSSYLILVLACSFKLVWKPSESCLLSYRIFVIFSFCLSIFSPFTFIALFCPFIFLSFCLFFFLSFRLSVFLSFRLSVSLYFFLFIFLSLPLVILVHRNSP